MTEKLFTRRHNAAGLVLYALIAPLAALAFFALAIAISPRVGALLNYAAFAVAVACLFGIHRAYITGRRMRHKVFTSADQVCRYAELREEPVFLFLREFRSDSIPASLQGNNYASEEAVVDYLQHWGTVVTVGRPGEDLPALGGVRLYLTNANWRDEVQKLIFIARLIIIRFGVNPGLSWELEQVATCGKLAWTLFLPSPYLDQGQKMISEILARLGGRTLSKSIPDTAETRWLDEWWRYVPKPHLPEPVKVSPQEALEYWLRSEAVPLFCVDSGHLVPVGGTIDEALDSALLATGVRSIFPD